MTSVAELLALADRIEREEGSRELNGAIYRLQYPDRKSTPGYASNDVGITVAWDVREYTTGAAFDLTAAMSLVPAGREVGLSYCGEHKTWEVIIDPDGGLDYNKTGRWHDIVVSAKTLKSALCAAALRAQAAEIGQ